MKYHQRDHDKEVHDLRRKTSHYTRMSKVLRLSSGMMRFPLHNLGVVICEHSDSARHSFFFCIDQVCPQQSWSILVDDVSLVVDDLVPLSSLVGPPPTVMDLVDEEHGLPSPWSRSRWDVPDHVPLVVGDKLPARGVDAVGNSRGF